MIDCKGIYKSFSTLNYVLEDVNLEIKKNEVYCLLGKNGAGKSTLLNIITQQIKPTKGSIYFNNKLLETDNLNYKNQIGVLNQDDYLIEQLTGYQYLIFQSLIYNINPKFFKERVKSLVNYFFDDFDEITRSIKYFSSGMKMRLKIIRSLLHSPNLLIMDEPFSNLDSESSEKLIRIIKLFSKSQNKTVLLSSHDLLYVDQLATQVIVLDNHQIVFNGTKNDFTSNNSYSLYNQLSSMIHTKESNIDSISWLFDI